MARLQIEIDDDTNRRLTELASEYEGDLSLALADLVHAHDALEEFAQHAETVHENALGDLLDRAEADFRENRTVPWDEVKARNGL
jgi:hypothetical protein